MDKRLVKSFVFNKTVLALVVGGCVFATIVDLFLDSSRDRIVKSSALEIAKSNILILNQLGISSIPSFQNHIRLEPIEGDGSNEFQKNALAALQKDPSKPYYEIDEGFLHYAATISGKLIQFDLNLEHLTKIQDRESAKTLWILLFLAIATSGSLAIFFGYLRHSLDLQKLLTRAYERFFPHQFLRLLNKESVLDIQLGDNAEKQMAVLFSDIRNFTSITERKTPAESFSFINEYLGQAAPIVRKNKGFIDKYIGDALMALFEQPEDAIRASIELNQMLAKTSNNVKEIGVGLHYGSMMVGTVGEAERMDGTVISDTVNTASRLEPLNKAYGTHILVTSQMLDKITQPSFKIRFIDHIYAVGKEEGLQIFEIFDTDPPELIQKKEQLIPIFENAINSYRNKNFSDALQLFNQCLAIYPEDKVTALYIRRTEKYLAEPPDASWTPITRLSTKDDVK